eukprot:jgi/Chlat1/1908/Chrsp149S02217
MCDLRREGDVFVLTLTGDGEHRLNPTLIAAINGALEQVERSTGAAALVTTGEGKFFSNGLDLAWCQKQSPKQINEFMHSFMLLLARFMELGIPPGIFSVYPARALAAKKWDREVYSAIKKQFYKADIAELKSGDMGYGLSVGVLAKAAKSKL